MSIVNDQHVPVLRDAAVDALAVQADGSYIDGTFGRGGHSRLILSRLGVAGHLMALDRDPAAVAHAQHTLADDARFVIKRANFAGLAQVVEHQGWMRAVDGVLLDLGVSSPQLDEAARGFGFSRDAELDMRMDPESGESAAEWLASVSRDELASVLKTYGDERYARRIATAIVTERELTPITRTGQLAEIVKRAHPRWERHHHPATRSFQAIRLQVNGELDALHSVLQQAASVLRDGGRLVVISFHSLEDRIVKRALRRPAPNPDLPRGLPVPEPTVRHPWRALGKALKPGPDEVRANPRSRSAVMRVAERVSEVAA